MTTPVALITGGTSGIGWATADHLARAGHQVVVTGRDPERLAAAARDLPGETVALRADARSLSDTDRVVAELRSRFGRLDVLFLNAGITRPAPIGEVTEASFDELVEINFKGQYFTLQKALPLMVEGGSIVITVGIGVTQGLPGGTATAATRGALLSLVPSLAVELAPRRIRVNAVSPGAIDTPIWASVPDEMREGAARRIPFGRFGAADEVAASVAWLASEGSAYVTGQNIVVAGGSGLGL